MHHMERSWWAKTSLVCGETLQMNTWKPNKRKDCELLWQHFSRKWPGMCILADCTHNSSTRSVLYQEKLFQGCVSKRKSTCTRTELIGKEAKQHQKRKTAEAQESPGRGGRHERAENTALTAKGRSRWRLSHRVLIRKYDKKNQITKAQILV